MSKKFSLEKGSNRRFYAIMEDSSKLWTEMDNIQDCLQKIRISKLNPTKGIEKAKIIGNKIQDLIKDYNVWYEQATDFSFHPEITLKGLDDFDLGIGFLHYTSTITNRIFQLSHKLNNLTLGYYQIAAMTRYRKSQIGAMMYFSISIFIALGMALFDIISRYCL